MKEENRDGAARLRDRQTYLDAADAFRYTANRLAREAVNLDAKAARKRTSAQEQLKMAKEMDAKAASLMAEGAAKPEPDPSNLAPQGQQGEQ